MIGMNGTPIVGAGTQLDWSEVQFRQMEGHVKRLVQRAGGQIPIGDPGAFLTLGLILDKLAAIEERLARLQDRCNAIDNRLAQSPVDLTAGDLSGH